MKVILADNHGRVLGKDQTSANLALLYLGAYLQHQGDVEVELEYIPQVKSDTFHLERIHSFGADIYACSFTSFSARETYELIKRIKSTYPDVLVVCGGPHAVTHSEEILRRSGTDIVVIGEGEVTFHEIVKRFPTHKEHLSEISGIAYLKDGMYRKTPPRALISDIDSIPFPIRSLVNDSDFCGLTYSKARPNTEMVITRGCPLRCVFCANPVFRLKNGPLYRARSPQNIVLEVEQLYELGYREIYLHSDELNVNLEWSIDVCKAIAALGFRDLYFQCNLRVVPMSEELAFWMKQANFWLVRVGIESTSDRVLTGIKKKMSFDKTRNALEMLTAQRIKVFGFMMLFNFWEENGEVQHETAAEVRKTISDIYSLWRKRLIHYTSWQFANPVHGAEFYDIALRHGMIDKNYFPSDTWSSYKYLKEISKREFDAIYASARRQQGIMALLSGNFEWRNYRGIARKAYTMVVGHPG
ncbi:radical SAM protein [Nitrospira sp. MA-1]|nr:radical SAM protein [Nitrospira sp. MA-1]